MPFYMPRVADEYGNTHYPPAVIEAESTGSHGSLRVLAPEEIKSQWPTLNEKYLVKVAKSRPRMINQDEWLTVWETQEG